MTEELLRRLFPNASASTIRRNLADNAARVSARQPQSPELGALDIPAPRKAKGRARAVQCAERYLIVFHFYAVRPLDWDNWSSKELQDIVIRAGILPSDNWRVLQGSIVSHKVNQPEEEKTVIEITRLA